MLESLTTQEKAIVEAIRDIRNHARAMNRQGNWEIGVREVNGQMKIRLMDLNYEMELLNN